MKFMGTKKNSLMWCILETESIPNIKLIFNQNNKFHSNITNKKPKKSLNGWKKGNRKNAIHII